MKELNRKIIIDLYSILLFVWPIAIIIFFALYYIAEPNSKLSGIWSGLATGLIIAFIQLLITIGEHKKARLLKQLGIRRVLAHRDDEAFYRDLINAATKEIKILGNTVYRFLSDFADEHRPDKQALLHALTRKVKIKILLPKPDYLHSEHDRRKAGTSSERLIELCNRYNSTFECRYYEHAPSHSLVVVDDECLAGPIFPNISSKDSPAIYTTEKSPFVKPYLKYFDELWENAIPCNRAT